MPTIKLDTFDQSIHERQPTLGDLKLWAFPIDEYAGVPFFRLHCKTDGFVTAGETDAEVTVIQNDDTDGPKIRLSRTSRGVWPFEPSTIFSGGQANKFGVVWVTKDFLAGNNLNAAQVTKDRPKFPLGLGPTEGLDGARPSPATVEAFFRYAKLVLGEVEAQGLRVMFSRQLG